MEIEITQDHINKGIATDCFACPVTLAVLEHENVVTAGVGLKTINIVWSGDNKFYVYLLPTQVCKFIDDFDFRNDVKPFRFTLNTDDPQEPVFLTIDT